MNETPDRLPLPIAQSSQDPDEVARELSKETGGGPTTDTPLGTAWIWHTALQDVDFYRTALDTLAVNPEDWGDYRQVARLMSKLAIMTFVEDNEDDPDIKYVKFIDYAGDGLGQAFEDGKLDDFYSLTVVRADTPRSWHVWGLTHNGFPPVSEIRE